jgi:hypothetical protein
LVEQKTKRLTYATLKGPKKDGEGKKRKNERALLDSWRTGQ